MAGDDEASGSQSPKVQFVGQIGTIPEFDERKEDFLCYMERLEQFFLANDIGDNKQVPCFLSAIGSSTYQTLRNLASPDLPSSKSFDDLKKLLMSHFKPKPSVIAERCKFNNCYQRDNQGINEFIVEIKKLSEHCEFGTFLNDALRDRLVCGLNEKFKQIQVKLLVEDKLDFKKACDIALNMEMARKDTQQMQKDHEKDVNSVRRKSQKTPKAKPEFTKRSEINPKTMSGSASYSDCYRCGGKHLSQSCKFKKAECFNCHKTGHLAKVCRQNSRSSTQGKQTHSVNPLSEEGEEEDIGIFTTTSSNNSKSYMIEVNIAGVPITMELDTGAVVSLVPESIYMDKLSHLELKPTAKKLQAYGGQQLSLLGELEVTVKYSGQVNTLPLVVVKGGRQPLLGRNWLEIIKIDWQNIFTITQDHQGLINKYESVFQEGYGKIKDFQAHIDVKENASPIFYRPRPIPYALREAVENELDRLQKAGIIEKVDRSEWAAPVVVVPKSDGSIRLCGDYKVTVNKSVNEEQYPLPTVQDLLSKLAGGTLFSKIDLTHAYQQLELDEQSQPYLSINTHLGLFSYKRLPFGVSSAPSIFQKVMDQVLQGIPGVVCFFDDILITASSLEEHLNTLEEVLKRLEKNGIKAKFSKCRFLQEEIVYLGYKISAEGLHPTDEKTEAIANAPRPTNLTELKSYLGLLNYYGKFIRNLSDVVQPLNELQQKEKQWNWTESCEQAFKNSKQKLLESNVLVHYDVNKPLRLACDASPYGVGAVISHIMPNGEEKPIAFASRTLHKNEQNYAQLEKEALAIIFGVTKFHQYLYGRHFDLITDHQPLLKILGPYSGVPTLAAARLQRWALILSAYKYNIEYRRSEENANADAMSRLPSKESNVAVESNIFHFTYLDQLPLSAKDIREATRKDPVLSKVYVYVTEGWPKHVDDESLIQYYRRRTELSVEQGCILWGLRVVIPPGFRERLLQDLHESHPGMSRMKSLARSYFWWPGLDKDIENKVKHCMPCQLSRNSPPPSPLYPWKLCERPMQRIHIDFAELDSKHFMIITDVYSKWLEVFHMTTTTASKTIEVLRNVFAQFGLPDEVVSDNGPPHTSAEFTQFLKLNGIKHTLVPAYHPSSNGSAERSVQTVKAALKKQRLDQDKHPMSLQHQIANFLFKYRTTPHSVTGQTPAELFLKRAPRTKFSLLRPNLLQETEKKQERQKADHDKQGVRFREFKEGDQVLVKNTRGQQKWLPGNILKRKGPLTYLVRVQHRIRYVHVDHLLQSVEQLPQHKPDNSRILVDNPPVLVHQPVHTPTDLQNNQPSAYQPVQETLEQNAKKPDLLSPSKPTPTQADDNQKLESTSNGSSVVSGFEKRYPTRQRKAPDRLNL